MRLAVGEEVEPLHAGGEGRHEVGAREVVWRAHARGAEEDLEDLGQGRIGHVGGERGVALGGRGVEQVLVLEADHHLVDQRHAEAGDLHEVAALVGGLLEGGVVAQHARPRQHRRRPRADDRVAGVAGKARRGHLEHERGDVLVLGGARLRVPGTEGVGDVDEVEDLAEVDSEGLLALADEQPSVAGAPGDLDAEDELPRVGVVVGEGLLADVVHRLAEAAAGTPRHRGEVPPRALGDPTAGHAQGAALGAVERRVARSRPAAQRSHRDERHRDLLAAHRQGDVGQRLGAAELEAHVLDAVAGVVDVDAVSRVAVQAEVVRAAVGVLQRDVVGDEGDEVAAAGLVAAEHVEVGAVHLRHLGDGGGLAVAGGQGGRRRQQEGGGDAGQSGSRHKGLLVVGPFRGPTRLRSRPRAG